MWPFFEILDERNRPVRRISTTAYEGPMLHARSLKTVNDHGPKKFPRLLQVVCE
jgi:hypothetical protein